MVFPLVPVLYQAWGRVLILRVAPGPTGGPHVPAWTHRIVQNTQEKWRIIHGGVSQLAALESLAVALEKVS